MAENNTTNMHDNAIDIDSAIMSAVLAAEERQRTRIAQELHDGMGATLSSVNIYLNLILSGGVEVEEIFRTVRLAKDLVGQAIENVKEIADNLHPVILSRFGLVATIANMIETMEQQRIVRIGFWHDDYSDIGDKELELSLYRIINELITNTLKYANAKNACIELQRCNGQIILTYSDDGKGFDPRETAGMGMGISNIHGRAKSHGGSCELTSEPGKGMSVRITIPYGEPDAGNEQNEIIDLFI